MSYYLLYPQLKNCRRIFLRNMILPISIGVYDFEKTRKQRVMIDVDVFVPLAVSTPKNDQFDEVIDYDFIRNTIHSRVSAGHINLQETLSDDLVGQLLEHPHVKAVRLSVEKLDAYSNNAKSADNADCASVGIEVFRIKDD